MTWSYLTFALLALAANVLLVTLVVLRRHRDVHSDGPLLRIRERNLLETDAIDEIYQRIVIDAAFRKQFITQCLQLPCVSQSNEATTYTDIAPARLERFVVYVVRNLDDRHLLKLLDLLRVPIRNERLLARYQNYEATLPRCNRHQRILIGIGFISMLVMLLLPPWQQRHERRVHVVGGPHFRELLDAKTLGFDWIWTHDLPQMVTVNVSRDDLRTSVQHVHVPAVNYLQLSSQLAAGTILLACLVWNVRKVPPALPTPRNDRQLIGIEA